MVNNIIPDRGMVYTGQTRFLGIDARIRALKHREGKFPTDPTPNELLVSFAEQMFRPEFGPIGPIEAIDIVYYAGKSHSDEELKKLGFANGYEDIDYAVARMKSLLDSRDEKPAVLAHGSVLEAIKAAIRFTRTELQNMFEVDPKKPNPLLQKFDQAISVGLGIAAPSQTK